MRPLALAVAVVLSVSLIAVDVSAQRGASRPGAAPLPAPVPVTDRMLQNPDPADWLMWRRTFNTWGYSPLTQITRANVSQLALAWSRPLTAGIQEGTPLVYNGVMYIPNQGDIIDAVDAKTGEKKWEHEQITTLRGGALAPLLRRASVAYREERYEKLLDKLPDRSDAGTTDLLYPKAP